MRPANPPIPVTIISGFLGAGKTTLLNRIVQADIGLRAAVLVNDFGSINIDSQLVTSNDGNVMSLANGCICCSISDDLVGQLESLLRQPELPEYFLIEASGISDPGRIARVLNYPMFRGRIQLDTILTLLDAGELPVIKPEYRPLVMAQLEAADIVIINKVDSCTSKQLDALKEEWLFPDSRIYETTYADVPIRLIVAAAGGPVNKPGVGASDTDQSTRQDHAHDDLFESFSWQANRPVRLAAIKRAIGDLPNSVYRAKGFFFSNEMDGTPAILQLVGSRTEWSKGEKHQFADKISSLVLIGLKGSINSTEIQATLDKSLQNEVEELF